MRRALIVVAALALLASGCTSSSRSAGDISLVEGQLERLDDDGWVLVSHAADGDRVRAVTDSRLQVDGDQVFLLEDAEAVITEQEVELVHGDVVVDGDALQVRIDDAVVDGIGTFRVDAGATPRVAIYAGTAEVRRPGEGYRLQPYRQLSLTSRRFDGLDDPLAYAVDDPVDQRLLSKAINFDGEVARYSTRLAELYGTGLQPAAFYASFAEVQADEVDVLLQAAPNRNADGAVGPPADALIGLFVSRALAQGQSGDLASMAERVATLRAEGARWGLIAMALDLGQVTFGATVDQAVAAREVVEASAPAPAPVSPAAPAPTVPTVTDPDPGPAPTTLPAPPPPAPPPPPPEPDPDPVLGPVDTLIDEVLDIVPAAIGLLDPAG